MFNHPKESKETKATTNSNNLSSKPPRSDKITFKREIGLPPKERGKYRFVPLKSHDSSISKNLICVILEVSYHTKRAQILDVTTGKFLTEMPVTYSDKDSNFKGEIGFNYIMLPNGKMIIDYDSSDHYHKKFVLWENDFKKNNVILDLQSQRRGYFPGSIELLDKNQFAVVDLSQNKIDVYEINDSNSKLLGSITNAPHEKRFSNIAKLPNDDFVVVFFDKSVAFYHYDANKHSFEKNKFIDRKSERSESRPVLHTSLENNRLIVLFIPKQSESTLIDIYDLKQKEFIRTQHIGNYSLTLSTFFDKNTIMFRTYDTELPKYFLLALDSLKSQEMQFPENFEFQRNGVHRTTESGQLVVLPSEQADVIRIYDIEYLALLKEKIIAQLHETLNEAVAAKGGSFPKGVIDIISKQLDDDVSSKEADKSKDNNSNNPKP